MQSFMQFHDTPAAVGLKNSCLLQGKRAKLGLLLRETPANIVNFTSDLTRDKSFQKNVQSGQEPTIYNLNI
jgi:hypothetical protein